MVLLRGDVRQGGGRAVTDVLRTADGPMSNADIAGRVIEMKGWDAADAELMRSVAKKINDVRKRLTP